MEVDLPAPAMAALPGALTPGTHELPGTARLVVEVTAATGVE